MNQLAQPPSLSSGSRKYTDILKNLVEKKFCRIECKLADTVTITNGVKKEKLRWVKKKLWPEGQALKIEIIDTEEWKGIAFRAVEDTSIRNL